MSVSFGIYLGSSSCCIAVNKVKTFGFLLSCEDRVWCLVTLRKDCFFSKVTLVSCSTVIGIFCLTLFRVLNSSPIKPSLNMSGKMKNCVVAIVCILSLLRSCKFPYINDNDHICFSLNLGGILFSKLLTLLLNTTFRKEYVNTNFNTMCMRFRYSLRLYVQIIQQDNIIKLHLSIVVEPERLVLMLADSLSYSAVLVSLLTKYATHSNPLLQT